MRTLTLAGVRCLLLLALSHLTNVVPLMQVFEYCACTVNIAATVTVEQYSNLTIATCTENCTNDNLCVAADLTAPSAGVYTCRIYRGVDSILVHNCGSTANSGDLCFKKLQTTTVTTSTQTLISITSSTTTVSTTTVSTTTATSTSTCNRGAGDFTNVSAGCCLMSGVQPTVSNLSTYHCQTLCKDDVNCIGFDLREPQLVEHNCTRYFETGGVGTGELTGLTADTDCTCYAKTCNYFHTITTTTVTVFTVTVTGITTGELTTTGTTTSTPCDAGAIELVGNGCCESDVLSGYSWAEAANISDCVAKCHTGVGCLAVDVTAAGSVQLCRTYSGTDFGAAFTIIPRADTNSPCAHCWRIGCLTTTSTTTSTVTVTNTTTTTCPPGLMEFVPNGCCTSNASSSSVIFENWRFIAPHCEEMCETDPSCVALAMRPASQVKAVPQGPTSAQAEYFCTTYSTQLHNHSSACNTANPDEMCYRRAECLVTTTTTSLFCPLGTVEFTGNGCCDFIDKYSIVVGSLLKAHCMLECDSDPRCIAADVRDPSGDNYLCTLYFGAGVNFTTACNRARLSQEQCYKKSCFTTSTTRTTVTTSTGTSTTTSITLTTHTHGAHALDLAADPCPLARPRFSHQMRCCSFPGLSRLGDEFIFFQLETCINMCEGQPSCVAMDYHARLDGKCIFYQLWNQTTASMNESICDDAASADTDYACYRRFCDTTTTSITTQSSTASATADVNTTAAANITDGGVGSNEEGTDTNRGTRQRISFMLVVGGIWTITSTLRLVLV